MSQLKLKLPKKDVQNLYQFKSWDQFTAETTTSSQGDPGTTCTTIFTSTHFIAK